MFELAWGESSQGRQHQSIQLSGTDYTLVFYDDYHQVGVACDDIEACDESEEEFDSLVMAIDWIADREEIDPAKLHSELLGGPTAEPLVARLHLEWGLRKAWGLIGQSDGFTAKRVSMAPWLGEDAA